MFGFTRLTILAVLIVLAGIFTGITVGIAQTLPLSPESQERIRRALEGKQPTGESGDVVLDDILHVIKERGSVLDGSSLDPAAEEGESTQAATDAEMARAAELLLKTSRILEQIEPGDKTRQELVKKMRGEAVKLLSE